MKFKKIHLILIIASILVIIFALNYRSNKTMENTNKVIIEESLNREIEITPEIPKETIQKEETKEERVQKMYNMIPPGEIIVE